MRFAVDEQCGQLLRNPIGHDSTARRRLPLEQAELSCAICATCARNGQSQVVPWRCSVACRYRPNNEFFPGGLYKFFVLCLSAIQLAAGIWGLAGSRRALQWAALICPIAILAMLAFQWQWSIPWATLRSAEIVFIAFNLASTAVAVGMLRAAAAPLAALWGHWLLNSLLCGAMVFLAFFFRLF